MKSPELSINGSGTGADLLRFAKNHPIANDWTGLKPIAREAAETHRTLENIWIPLNCEVVGWQGLEPWTNALKGHCSTN